MAVGTGMRGTTGRTISTVSIGGTNGTIHYQGDTSGFSNAGVASRVVSSGNNNVTVTWSGGVTSCAVFVWLITGYNSATPTDGEATSSGTAGTSLTATFDIPASGTAVYVNTHNNANATGWSSATEQDDLTAEAQYAGADIDTATVLTAHVETASWTGSVGRAIAGASWQLSYAITVDAPILRIKRQMIAY
jgi:hypothetical protein